LTFPLTDPQKLTF